MTSPYVDVLKTQQMRLAEQPIYGSSRVGVASYWPGQYDAVWDYTTGTQDTLRLLGIKPWYSATLEGYKPAGSTEPYDNSSLGLASAAHLLGQKNYELSNHLGNVQATLSDKRYVQKQYYTASDSLRKGYAASVSSLYDYYPFGMLMKERCTSDTATQSVYASQVVYSPQYTTVNNAMTGASITSLNTTTQTNYNGSVNYFGQSASISKTLSNLQSGIPVSMKINLLYTNKPLYLTLQQGSTLLYSTTMNSSGTYSFNFTPTQSMVQLSIAYSYFNTNANTLCFTLDSVNYQQQSASLSSTQLVQVSNKINDGYRFGFNGQEKDNEIAGVGNHNTAEFWEYDTRVGRRWNTDPVVKPWESSYACFANNPIWYSDPLGNVAGDYYKSDGSYLGSDGKTDNKTYVADGKKTIDIKDDKGLVVKTKTEFINAKELPIKHTDFTFAAQTLYAESSPKASINEVAGIYSVLENRAESYGTDVISQMSPKYPMGVYGSREKDRQRYSEKGTAADEKRLNVKAGLILGITSNIDYSNGGFFWDGTDFKSGGGHEQRYKPGYKFSDPKHDIYKLGDNLKLGKTKFGSWNHKYQSTTVIQKTTFSKLSQEWREAQYNANKMSNPLGD